MSATIIIFVCILLLVAYLFDLTSVKTKMPTVILLLFMGWGVRQICNFLTLDIPDFAPLLPAFGAVGLLLIVLEGSLELDFDLTKMTIVKRSFFVAVLSILYLAIIIMISFHYFGGFSMRDSLICAIPISVISSSIAIPSTVNADKTTREFVIFESSLSDIVGVLFFNFIVVNEILDKWAILQVVQNIAIVIVVSFVFTIALAFLLSKITNHVKFAPIILIVILVYFLAHEFNLPGLLFILILGLFLGNIEKLKNIRRFEKLQLDELHLESIKLREIVIEATFLVRSFFFLLFGFLMETAEIINPQSFAWSASIFVLIILLRWLALKLFKIPFAPVGFIAPRGLITILLFLSIPAANAIPLMNKSIVIQIIVLTSLFMMLGSLLYSKPMPKEITKE